MQTPTFSIVEERGGTKTKKPTTKQTTTIKPHLFQIENMFPGLQLHKVYSKIFHLSMWKAVYGVPSPKLKYGSFFNHHFLFSFFRSSFRMLGQCYIMQFYVKKLQLKFVRCFAHVHNKDIWWSKNFPVLGFCLIYV